MASSKKRTTMAKLAREQKLRERRVEKQARKDARRNGTADDRLGHEDDGVAGPGLEPAVTEAAPDGEETLTESQAGLGGGD
jgi:hypothetical protein